MGWHEPERFPLRVAVRRLVQVVTGSKFVQRLHNEQPVKIVGSHAGVSVGPDGATHQMLEDIALMRVLPNMIVAPGDEYWGREGDEGDSQRMENRVTCD